MGPGGGKRAPCGMRAAQRNRQSCLGISSVVIWNVLSHRNKFLPIRQTKTGNLYKLKRIHFQKNKLLRGEEGPFLNKYVIRLT